MLPLGTPMPDFELVDTVSGQLLTPDALAGPHGTVIAFICNHCPFVLHINQGFVRVANEYISRGIHFAAISSNDIDQYPQDGPEHMRRIAHDLQYPFSYLFDEDQEVARRFDAACTPDFYLFDRSRRLVYRGQFDDSRPGNGIPVTATDLRAAMDALLSGNDVPVDQRPSLGCNIKWKPAGLS